MSAVKACRWTSFVVAGENIDVVVFRLEDVLKIRDVTIARSHLVSGHKMYRCPSELRHLVSGTDYRLLKVLILSKYPTEDSSLVRCFLLIVTTEILLSNFKLATLWREVIYAEDTHDENGM